MYSEKDYLFKIQVEIDSEESLSLADSASLFELNDSAETLYKPLFLSTILAEYPFDFKSFTSTLALSSLEKQPAIR